MKTSPNHTDPLAILLRGIDAFNGAPVERRDALFTRLMRQTAPVLEERESLLTFLDRGYDWIDANPAVPDREERVDRWIVKLQRLEAIEDVLASFPASNGSPSSTRPMTESVTALTLPSLTPLPRPP